MARNLKQNHHCRVGNLVLIKRYILGLSLVMFFAALWSIDLSSLFVSLHSWCCIPSEKNKQIKMLDRLTDDSLWTYNLPKPENDSRKAIKILTQRENFMSHKR